MSTVSDLKKRLEMVNVRSLTADIVKTHEQKIVDLNREDQIFIKGIDALGRSLEKYAQKTQKYYDDSPPSDTTGFIKDAGTPYNLFWTGKSYYGFKTYIRGDKLYITTNARGRKLLLENGSVSIFGLIPENQEVLNWEIIAPDLIEAIKKIL